MTRDLADFDQGDVMDTTTKIKLDPGSWAVSRAKEPVIEVNSGAGGTYLWFGNDTEGEQFCFGTLGPRKKELRRLRDALNKILGDNDTGGSPR